MPNHSLEKVQV